MSTALSVCRPRQFSMCLQEERKGQGTASRGGVPALRSDMSLKPGAGAVTSDKSPINSEFSFSLWMDGNEGFTVSKCVA